MKQQHQPKPGRQKLFLCLLAALASNAASGQTILLRGATVHTVSGQTYSPGEVLIKDGKISAVGATVSADGAEKVELGGQHLYPGLIALDTALGLTEISGVRSTQDTTEVGDFTPDVQSWIAVNPDSELLPVARANGIAYFQPVPEGGIVSGQSGLVTTDGWTSEQMAFHKPMALDLFWPSQVLNVNPRERARGTAKVKSLDEQAKERRARLRAIEDFFEEAKAYSKAQDAVAKGQAAALQKIPAWEAMLPYVSGKLPIMVHADEIRQIKAAISWAVTNHYQIILAGGRDSWMVADLLASNRIPVVFGATFLQPARDTEGYDSHFKAPEILRHAGVLLAFSLGSDSFDAALTKNLPYSAAQAIGFGLPEADALKALTLNPAQIAGVAGRLGSIEVGKEASVFAADGDILDIRTHVTRVWLAGKEATLQTRHTRLYDKYRNRPAPR